MEATRAMSPESMQRDARDTPRTDPVGTAANELREYVCDSMGTANGISKWLPFFAHLAGRMNSPHGGGADRDAYLRHVRGLRSRTFADQLNLPMIAQIMGVRIVVVPQTPGGAPTKWAITDVGEDRGNNTIYLGNDDTHYVWLRPC